MKETIAVTSVILVIAGLFVWAIVYDYRHPCIKFGPPKECQQTYCSYTDDKGNCQMWTTSPYDCTDCLERKP